MLEFLFNISSLINIFVYLLLPVNMCVSDGFSKINFLLVALITFGVINNTFISAGDILPRFLLHMFGIIKLFSS